MIAEARDFWDWWRSELAAGFGQFIATSRKRDAGEPHELSPGSTQFDPAATIDLSRYDPDDQSLLFLGRHLTISLGDRRLPFSRAQDVAMAVATTNTPFRASEIILLPKGQDMNAFALIRKDMLRPLLDDIMASGKRVARLGILDGGNIVWVSSRALENLHPLFAPLRRRRIGVGTAATLLLLTAVATYGHVFYRYAEAEAEIAQIVETNTAEALAVRKLLDRQKNILAYAEAARLAKNEAIPVVEVWEELTRRLPDDVWVTDMGIDADSVVLTGFAQASAALIGEIGASGLLKDAAFTAPVVRMPDDAGERFELRARMRRP